MKTKKQKLLVLALCAFALLSCGGKKTDSSNGQSATQSEALQKSQKSPTIPGFPAPSRGLNAKSDRQCYLFYKRKKE